MTDVVARLEAALGDRVRTDAATCAAHARDAWVVSELRDLAGHPPPAPRAVVLPRDTREVATTLRLCRETRTPVVPFGGGSGVCGGIETRPDVVVLSTRALSGLRELDPHDLVARFGAGTNGAD